MMQHRRIKVVKIDDVRCADQVGEGKVRGGVAEPDQVIRPIRPARHDRPGRLPVPPEQRTGGSADHPAAQSPDARSFGPLARPYHGASGEGKISRRRFGCAALVEDHGEKLHGAQCGQGSQHPAQPLPIASPRRPGIFVGDDEDSQVNAPSPQDQPGCGRGAE